MNPRDHWAGFRPVLEVVSRPGRGVEPPRDPVAVCPPGQEEDYLQVPEVVSQLGQEEGFQRDRAEDFQQVQGVVCLQVLEVAFRPVLAVAYLRGPPLTTAIFRQERFT